ncbi:ArnT family glycosyltransferase [Leptolyngbya sp. AN02str]|uniref:ArnT family glycosyltransferase n=1 Tax=Leptolyngbya sp. AN02str TaxID=3423363 RepID=UPI003D323536
MRLAIPLRDRSFLIFNLLIPVGFAAFVLLFMPIDNVFAFDTDEGIELIRASLYSKGFALYSEIWSDHPPFLTVLLAQWLDWVGHTIVNARLLALFFATLLVWTTSQLVRMTVGPIPAILSAIWLTASSQFLRLSVSIMIGLPALALTTLAIYLVLLYQTTSSLLLLLLSAVLFAIALQTKIFLAFVAPILVLYWLLSKSDRLTQFTLKTKDLLAPFIWVVSIVIVFLATLPLLKAPSIQQTIAFHFESDTQSVFGIQDSILRLLDMILNDIDYWFLAIVGIVWLVRQKTWFRSFPLLWLSAALLLLVRHKPIWYHHYQLFCVPLIWLAAYGASFVLAQYSFQKNAPKWRTQWSQKSRGIKLATACLILALVAVPIKLTFVQVANHQRFIANSTDHFAMLEQVRARQADTEWLFTDYPIYGFYADLKVPPEIAVFSRKRLVSGNLTPEELQRVFRQYQPEQVVLGRFPEVRAALQVDLAQGYSLAFENPTVALFVKQSP